MSRKGLSRKVTRRALLAGSAAGAAAALGGFPAPAIAQAAPFKLGLLTVKTGPLAQGGIQMEQGVLTYLKETDYTMAGRKVELVTADTGGAPAGAKTKAQELVERDKVDVILGPLAAFELLRSPTISASRRRRRSASRRPTTCRSASPIRISCARRRPRRRRCSRWAITRRPN